MPHQNKKKGSIFIKLVEIVLLSAAIYLLAGVGIDAYNSAELEKQRDQVAKELEALKNENAALNSTKDKLEDEDYVQTYARGEYMFSLDDEKVFYLPSSSNEGE